MRRRAFTAAFPLFLTAIGCVSAPPLYSKNRSLAGRPISTIDGFDPVQRRKFMRQIIASTVRIRAARYDSVKGLTYWTGTGAIIDREGLTLTAYHIIQDADFITMTVRTLDGTDENDFEIENGREIAMKTVRASKDRDLALLEPVHRGQPLPEPLPMSDGNPRLGEVCWQFGVTTVWAVGRIMEQADPASESSKNAGAAMLGRHGDSGAPLINARGEIAGVLILLGKNESATYFVPVSDVREELDLN